MAPLSTRPPLLLTRPPHIRLVLCCLFAISQLPFPQVAAQTTLEIFSDPLPPSLLEETEESTIFTVSPSSTIASVEVDASASTLDNFVQTFAPSVPDNAAALEAQLGVPFRFTNIFLIGGQCYEPDNWYSAWIKAGLETLQNVTKVICAEESNTVYTREFHLDALQQVQDLAGDYLNETLVITVAVGLESDWTPVADLLRQGMAFFHAKEDPHNFNVTEYGLDTNEILYFYFQWDEITSAINSGRELCRLNDGAEALKISKLYPSGRDGGLNYRVDLALEAFQESCPETQIIELWEGYDDLPAQSIKALLTFKRVPDIVLTGMDVGAKHFLTVAEEVLSAAQYSLIQTTGWDFLYPDLLGERKILTTVDQQVLYPNRGVWKVMDTVLQLIENGGLRTTKSIQENLLLGDSLTIQSDTMLISADQVGYLHADLLSGYNSGSPPSRSVQVSTGLHNVTIMKMDPFETKFDAVIWMRLSWEDPRLEFDPAIYDDSLPIESEKIWVPALFYENEVRHFDLYTTPASVTFDGVVVVETHTQATFLCETTSDLAAFPFDSYDCSIDLGAPQGILLDSNFGFDLSASDPHFMTETYIYSDNATDTTVHYGLRFDRKPFTAYVRLILPAVLINMVGFMAFWIPNVQESVALGITSLLCSLAFRETVEIPDTSGITWTEVFMLVNIFYQASVMFIIWCSYSPTNGISHTLNAICRKVHPKKVPRAVSQTMKHSKKQLIELSQRGAEEINFVGAEDNFVPQNNANDGRPANGRPENYMTTSETQKIWDSSDVLVKGDMLAIGAHSAHSRSIPESAALFGNGSGNFEPNSFASVSDDASSVRQYATTTVPQPTVSARRVIFSGMDALPDDDGDDKTRDEDDTEMSFRTEDTSTYKSTNVDWIGRWFVVPSYIIVMTTLIFSGWGFTDQ